MKKEVIKIKVDVTKCRNTMHFDVQRTTRMNVFKDKTIYTRKEKHRTVFAY